MERDERQLEIVEVRSVVERLVLPTSEQVEWLSRKKLRPDELALASLAAVQTGLQRSRRRFSPVLCLRLEALSTQLSSLLAEPDSMSSAPSELLQHSFWAELRHLAEVTLDEPGWPSI